MTKKEDKKLNITLILAAGMKDSLTKKDPFMPLSLPILASVAPKHNYTFIDMLWEPEKVDFDTPDELIGISLRQSAELTAYEIADEFIKRGKTVVLGGAQASAVPYRAKEHAASVVIGEAEELWPILLQDYQNKKLKDFYVSSPKKFDAKGMSLYQSENMPDLKNLPTPKRSLYKRNYTFDLTFASRGCPIDCDFCLVSDLFGKKLRFKPIDDVIKDIKQFKRFYYLLDDTVFGRPSCYDYYLELYDKLAQFPKRKYWTGQANLDAVNHEKGREVIKKAAKSGLVYAAVGLESINRKTLEDSGSYAKMGIKNKDEYIADMKEHIAFIQKQGIIISGWFAIGYETDTLQTYYDTLKFCEETNILPVFTPIRAIPGSRLWHKMQSDNRLQDLHSHISNIKHPKLSDPEIAKAMLNTAKQGYSFKMNWKRLKFYFAIFRKSEQNVHDTIFKTIFAFITQNKMQKIVYSENKRLIQRFEQNI